MPLPFWGASPWPPDNSFATLHPTYPLAMLAGILAREEMLCKLHVRGEYYCRRARQSFAQNVATASQPHAVVVGAAICDCTVSI